MRSGPLTRPRAALFSIVLAFAVYGWLSIPVPCCPGANCPTVVAQTQEPVAAAAGVSFSDPVESTWEFGLQIRASSNARGITASIPIPMDWPEQDVEIIREKKTSNVGEFRKKNPTKLTRQFSFNVNRISGRQPESGTIQFKIKKRFIIAPKDTTRFVIADLVPKEQTTFLKPSPFIESDHQKIVEIANDLRDDSLGGWEQVETNLRWVRDNVRYRFDRQIHSCLEALASGRGDCEELSSLFIAICRAQGIPARAVWVPDHTYPEFYLEDELGNGHWFPCQAAGPYEFGSMSDPKPILQKGDRFRVPGEKNDVRYIRPSLVARNSNRRIEIDWIARKLVDQHEPGRN